MCPPSSCSSKRIASVRNDPARSAPVKESPQPAADQLIRALTSLTGGKNRSELPACPEENEEVLVDVELDGFRYLLVRLPKPTAMERVSLSPREQEIVRMVAQGHPNKVIAGVLNISGWTVCTHLRRIFAKLRVGSRAAMVARILETGSVDNRIRFSPEIRGIATTQNPAQTRPRNN